MYEYYEASKSHSTYNRTSGWQSNFIISAGPYFNLNFRPKKPLSPPLSQMYKYDAAEEIRMFDLGVQTSQVIIYNGERENLDVTYKSADGARYI